MFRVTAADVDWRLLHITLCALCSLVWFDRHVSSSLRHAAEIWSQRRCFPLCVNTGLDGPWLPGVPRADCNELCALWLYGIPRRLRNGLCCIWHI